MFDFSKNKTVMRLFYSFIVLFFLLLILLPTIFVLGWLIIDWVDLELLIRNDPEMIRLIISAILISLTVSICVTFLDIIFALPLAWKIARSEFRGKNFLRTIIDTPLAVPTAGLGMSVTFYWTYTLNFVNNSWILMVFFHIVTTLPLVVGALSSILEEIDETLEIAARASGASIFTAFRTITLPEMRPGFATAIILAFAKSLSDTGGVVSVLTTFYDTSLENIPESALNGTALINVLKHAFLDTQIESLRTALAFVSSLMILMAILLLFLIQFLTRKARFKNKKVFPNFEKKISSRPLSQIKEYLSFVFLIFFLLIPSFFILTFIITEVPKGTLDLDSFSKSLVISIIIAGSATLLNVIMGIPMAIFIARNKVPRLTRILDLLINVPYVVPSAALGFSISLFYAPFISSGADLFLAIMAHASMTYPYIVQNVRGALEKVSISLEDTARSLGASPQIVFSRITFPIIKAPLLAGMIMSFTRSMGETGASTSVRYDESFETAPIFILKQIGDLDYYTAALTTIVLIIVSASLIFTARYISSRE